MIGGIIAAISGVDALVSAGRGLLEAVTGEPSRAETAEELEREVLAQPHEVQAAWGRAMQAEIERYRAETERLEVQGGRVTRELQRRVSQATADRVVYLRQTTRPWCARVAMLVLAAPFALAFLDGLQGLVAAWVVQPFGIAFGFDGMARFDGYRIFTGVFGAGAGDHAGALEASVLGSLYVQSVPWLTGIVTAYCTLRMAEKIKGRDGDPPRSSEKPAGLGGALSAATGLAGSVADMVRAVRRAAGR